MNLLCCLLDAGPLAVPQLAALTGESEQAVRYWIGLLCSFGLVEAGNELSYGETPYAACLDAQPEWVRDAVRQHRPRAI